MQITGSFHVPAPRDRVWEALNDPEILRQCIPGCELLVRLSDTEFEGKVVSKIGPVKATFTGRVTLSDIDPPSGYTISGEGKGGVAGFAKGGAKVALKDADGGGTTLDYVADASVGGKIAQLGGRLIEAAAGKTAEDFFSRFTELLTAAPAAPGPSPEPAVPADAPQPAPEPDEPPPEAAPYLEDAMPADASVAAAVVTETVAAQARPRAGGAWKWWLIAAAIVVILVVWQLVS